MSDKMNIHDFMGKIEWEGGVSEALDYGLKTDDYDLPKHLVDQWNELRALFADLADLRQDWYAESYKFADTVPFEED